MKTLSDKRRAVLAFLTGACLLVPMFSHASEKPGYKVGDRLPEKAAAAEAGYKQVTWEALMPADWNPAKDLQALDLGNLSDSDPRAIKALEQLRAALDNAPVVSSLNGTRIRIAGFTVPLESARGQISEFLLVPYFGACIHTPPPPANQIIHVTPAKPFRTSQAIDAVWVSGVIETVRSETGLGNAGYRMRAESIAPYKR
ncbi:MAG: DUF3299 domain-containing protein [Burkholderiales bacterium]